MATAEQRKLKVLIAKKESLFLILQGLFDMSKSLQTPLEKQTFLIRYKSIEATRVGLLEVIDDIMELSSEIKADFKPDYLNTIDELCCHIHSAGLLVERDTASPRTSTTLDTVSRTLPSLPRIELPEFSGEIREWETFYSIFNSLIHENNALTDVDKVSYLIGRLKGSALSVCTGLAPTGSNYGIIWQALIDKYQDKRSLACSYLNQMLDFKTIQGESAKNLDLFLENFDCAVQALKKVGLADLSDFILMHHALSKLDLETVRAFEMSRRGSGIPTYEDVIKFVKEQTKILSLNKKFVIQSKLSKSSSVYDCQKSRSPKSLMVSQEKVKGIHTSDGCVFCHKGWHYLYRCDKFKRLTPSKRYETVRDKNWCYNCLSPNHGVRMCTSQRTCPDCGKRHHGLLHTGKTDSQYTSQAGDHGSSRVNTSDSIPNGETTQNIEISANSLCATSGSDKTANHTVLLSTVVVHIANGSSNNNRARFVLDSGSQAHLITVRCSRRLGLDIKKCFTSIQGLGSISNSVRGSTQVIITSRYNLEKKYCLEALVVEKISDKMPRMTVDTSKFSSFKNIQLADETFDEPGEIDGILGADLFAQVIQHDRIFGSEDSPVAIKTAFGYVVMGKVPVLEQVSSTNVFLALNDELSLEQLVGKFWEMEQAPSKILPDPEEVLCEKIFVETYSRDDNGQFTVALPFRNSVENLGESKIGALSRLLSLERRLAKNPGLRLEYNVIMKDFIDHGYMHKVENEIVDSCFYIPHHAVFKPESTSTPIRVVLDASAPSNTGISLNDILYGGPKLQTDIFSLLINFRLFKIAVTADVRKMFLQIKVIEGHWRFQRILWRFNPQDEVQVYELNRVSFGVKSSPYLALRTVKQLILEEGAKYSLAAEVVPRDLYMDDLVSSVASEDEAHRLYRESVDLFAEGKFDLTKWSSNSSKLLQLIPTEKHSAKTVVFKTDTKILGMQWITIQDGLYFKFQIPGETCTKRMILAAVARCYDPIGLVAPFIFFLKLLVKGLWRLKLGWDDEAPVETKRTWQKLREEWSQLEELQLPRHIAAESALPVSLLGFADASTDGYGAVVYVRSIRENGEVLVNLLCAKSKVSPFKLVTIPRLELCAAVLLTKLMKHVIEVYESRIVISKVWLFSDSTVVIQWLNTPQPKDIFVANRVGQIREKLPTACWRHIAGVTNPADDLSRGLTPSNLVRNVLWATGPSWAKLPESDWPVTIPNSFISQEEVFVVATMGETHPFYDLIERRSSWLSILRITVWILRFLKIIPFRQCISASDLWRAESVLIKIVQARHFQLDIECLNKRRNPSNKLLKLRPFIRDGLLRVGGRLGNSYLKFSEKHPILLSGKDPFTERLVDYYHIINLHTGPHLLEAILRQKYWILGSRNLVRRRVHACNRCFRLKPSNLEPLMADLPAPRVQTSKVFCHTGLDYFGPFSITHGRKRGAQVYKAYVCLFVCMSVKAVHLELVSSLSTDHFLQALKRFLARRGPCQTLYSDRGSNFVGAKTFLKELNNFVSSNEYKSSFETELAIQGIEWKMNVPSAPHMGGLWKSNVKAAKTHIYRVIGGQLLTYEEFATLLTQVEALLNSRPLCSLPSDPSSPEALTPSHFLTLTPLRSIPANDLTEIKMNRLDRFQLIDRMVRDYWKRWQAEYLTTLQTRQKWNVHSPNIKVGTVVILKNDNTPPLHWPLAVITDVHPGKDGIIRNITLKTSKGSFMRPVVKVCPLPTQ